MEGINHVVSNGINTIVIGHNRCWKQEINIGKRNNQNFVSIPFNMFISMISYKATLEGINVKIVEESYTSKCSFWITRRFVSMRNMLEDVSNEDCSRHLPAILLTPISMVRLTSLENRQKKPSM